RSAAWRCSKTARRTSACAGPPRHAPWNSPPSESCPATRGCIRTCWVIDVLRLVRAHNLVVAAAGVLAGGWIALGTFATPKLLVFAALAGVGFGAAGNAMNDIWDAAADRVNRSPAERPLAARRLSRGTADLCVVGRTLPITLGSRGAALIAAALGVAFVPASLVLPYVARYHGAYYVLALFAQLTVLLVASRLITGKMERNSLLLKGAMIVGIVSLVA